MTEDTNWRAYLSYRKKLLGNLTELLASHLDLGAHSAAADNDSPIETILLIAINAVFMLDYRTNGIDVARRHDPENEYWRKWLVGYKPVVIPQYQLDGKRFDFAVFGNGRFKPLLVECDGHDFHERTKEQAAKDRSRDREMVSKGYRIIRFTGAEIYADPVKCAQEIIDLHWDLYDAEDFV